MTDSAYNTQEHLKALAAAIAEPLLDTVLARSADVAQCAVLDVGCGCGYNSQSLRPHVGQIVGIDNSESAVDTYNSVLGGPGGCPCRALMADAMDADALVAALQAASVPQAYRLAFSHMSLHHVSDIRAVLRTLMAVTEPGGFVAVSDILRTPRSLVFHKPGAHRSVAHMGGFDADDVAQNMKDLGLQDVHVIPDAATIEREVVPAMEALLPEWRQSGQRLFDSDSQASEAVASAGTPDGAANVVAQQPLSRERHPIFLAYGTKAASVQIAARMCSTVSNNSSSSSSSRSSSSSSQL